MGSGAFIETKKNGEKCDYTHLSNVLVAEVTRQGLGRAICYNYWRRESI